MKTPHKHADIIKAWADGAEIEFFDSYHHEWKPIGENPMWSDSLDFRIKPAPKPDEIRYGIVLSALCSTDFIKGSHNARFTFDGETGKLKSAEVL
jgi:hypothetical protein